MLLFACLAAHATTYTDTLGSATTADYAAAQAGYGAVFANVVEVTESVDLAGVSLWVKESDSGCSSCSIAAYLWTYDAATGTWGGGASLGGTLYIAGTSFAWESDTVLTTRLEAGTTYAIGFWTQVDLALYRGPGSDPRWGTVDGRAYASDVTGPSYAFTGLDGADPWYMQLTVEVPDDDGDGHDAVDDCDDADAATYPGAAEVWYDGQDQDCDGGSDYDQDGDGYDQDDDDCDDEDPAIRPGAGERWYDGVDQDCAGDDDYDQDRDGDPTPAGGGTDCDDEDPGFGAHAEEEWYDGVDQDCQGDSDFDQDGDGHDTPSAGGDDCDDTDPAAYPGAPEAWYDDVDQACDGGDDQDQDGDGIGLDAGDCDDTDGSVHPGAVESWYDGVDQDCDGGSDYDQDGDGFEAGVNGATGDDCDDLDAGAWDDCGGGDEDETDGGGKGAMCGTPAGVGLAWVFAAGIAARRRRTPRPSASS